MTSFSASPGGQGEESTQHYKDKVFYTTSSCCFLYNNIAAPQLFMVFVLSLIICMVYISKEEDANYRTPMEIYPLFQTIFQDLFISVKAVFYACKDLKI